MVQDLADYRHLTALVVFVVNAFIVHSSAVCRSMDNIAVVAVDLRPPAQELEPTIDSVGADHNARLTFPGGPHS